MYTYIQNTSFYQSYEKAQNIMEIFDQRDIRRAIQLQINNVIKNKKQHI